MIALAQFTGALITLLTMPNYLPTDLRADSGELAFFMAPTFQIAGLMCLMAAPKPPKRTLSYEDKEKFQFEYKYPGHKIQSFFGQTIHMLAQFFSFETLAVFPFVFVSATYVSEIESSF